MANTPKPIRRLHARLQAKVTDVLGNREKAIGWMKAPNRALGGATPTSVLDIDTAMGSRAAEDVLVRIEYDALPTSIPRMVRVPGYFDPPSCSVAGTG